MVDVEQMQIEVELEEADLEVKEARVRTSREFDSEVTDLKHMGLVKMYHAATGEPHWILRSLAAGQLKKRLPDGRRAFTLNDPGFRPEKGKLHCPLHKDSPERKLFDTYGFITCQRSGLRSEFSRMEHFRSKHPRTWEAWQRSLAREQETDAKTVSAALAALLEERMESNKGVATCPHCEWYYEHAVAKVAAMERGKHIRDMHPRENR